ncbi:hypothetical protein [Mesorhizobium sp. CA7]|uniref:hypothetical protein n=1 Tax=Mesorhizobium sp. CA7 TaxID=588501 RepID=UPI001CCB95C8|nr:hypothetical protein [Mesorhizobium sp. CA7]MBZ9814749.1 hypothetical protein [Mesorhizobium sp. CA7]
MSKQTNSLILIGAVAVVLVLIGAAVSILWATGISAVVGLPMLSIGAVIVLVILLCLLSVVFASFDLQDKTQALALPEGSIRAVIALMLIVLFAILSIYLFGSLATGQLIALGAVDEAQRAALISKFGERNIVYVPEAGGKSFNVWFRDAASQDGIDFAKQLLVLVGTLVTSISSFYFGSKAVTPSADRAAAANSLPSIESIDPPNYSRGSGAQDFTIQGTNLERVSGLKLRLNGRDAKASIVDKTASQIRFKLDIPATEQPGIWQLILTDPKLGEQRMPQGITVT